MSMFRLYMLEIAQGGAVEPEASLNSVQSKQQCPLFQNSNVAKLIDCRPGSDERRTRYKVSLTLKAIRKSKIRVAYQMKTVWPKEPVPSVNPC